MGAANTLIKIGNYTKEHIPHAIGITTGIGLYYGMENISEMADSTKSPFFIFGKYFLPLFSYNIVKSIADRVAFRELIKDSLVFPSKKIVASIENQPSLEEMINPDVINPPTNNIARLTEVILSNPKKTALLMVSAFSLPMLSTPFLYEVYTSTVDNSINLMKWTPTIVGGKEYSPLVGFLFSPGLPLLMGGFIYYTYNLIDILVKGISFKSHSKSSPIFIPLQKAFRKEQQGKFSEALEILDYLPVKEELQDMAFLRSQIYAKQGNLDDALISLSNSMKRPNIRELGLFYLQANSVTSLLSSKSVISKFKKVRRSIAKEPDNPDHYLQKVRLYLDLKKLEGVNATMDEIGEHFPDHIELTYLRAIFAEEQGEKDKARMLFNALATMILTNPKFSKHSYIVDETVNRVVEYAPNRYIKNALIFKQGNLDQLMKEMRWTQMLSKRISGSPFSERMTKRWSTAVPLTVLEHTSQGVYVMKRAPGVRFSDLNETVQEQLLPNYGEILGIIHALMPRESRPAYALPMLESSLNSCQILTPCTREEIKSYCARIFSEFDYFRKVFLKDAHGENMLITPKSEKDQSPGLLTLLDFDDKGIGHPVFDTVKVINQAGAIWRQKSAIEDRVLSRYVEVYNDTALAEDCVLSSEEFLLQHLQGSVLKALSYYCFSYNKQKKERMRMSFMANTLQDIFRIQSDFPDEYKKNKEAYDGLSRIIISLPITNQDIEHTLKAQHY